MFTDEQLQKLTEKMKIDMDRYSNQQVLEDRIKNIDDEVIELQKERLKLSEAAIPNYGGSPACDYLIEIMVENAKKKS